MVKDFCGGVSKYWRQEGAECAHLLMAMLLNLGQFLGGAGID